MTAPLSICTKEEQRVVIQFLWTEGVPGQKFIADFQHNMVTVLYRSGVCMIGLPCSQIVTQVSLLMNDLDNHPRPEQKKPLNESPP